MGRKKDESKKFKTISRKPNQSEKVKIQEKIDRLVQSLWKKISNPIDTVVKPEQRFEKLAFLHIVYAEFNRIFDAYQLSRVSNGEKFKNHLKKNFARYLHPSRRDYIQSLKKFSTKKLLASPDGFLISILSYFLAPKWDPIKDPAQYPILFEFLFFYYELIEERLPPSIIYQMDLAVMRFIWEVKVTTKQMDYNGVTRDRTNGSNEITGANKELRKEKIIAIWNQLKDQKGATVINQMTRNKIATLIQTNSRKSSLNKKDWISINTIIPVLEEHFKNLNQSPPWRPIRKKFIKT